MKGTKLKERAKERRYSLSSELQNVSLVRNKCEQVQLEKKQRFLAKAMEKQSIGRENKRRELIGLSLASSNSNGAAKLQGDPTARRGSYVLHRQNTAANMLPSKDNGSCSSTLQDGRTQSSTNRRFLLSRSRSLTGINTIPSIIKETTANTSITTTSRFSGLCSHVKLWQSLGSSLGPKCRMCELLSSANGREDDRYSDDDEDDDDDDEDESKKGRVEEANIGKLLPPPCLMSIHEQNSMKEARLKAAAATQRKAGAWKSRKIGANDCKNNSLKTTTTTTQDKNSNTTSSKGNKTTMSATTTTTTTTHPTSWHSLSNCRYLRTWKNRWYCYNDAANKCSGKIG